MSPDQAAAAEGQSERVPTKPDLPRPRKKNARPSAIEPLHRPIKVTEGGHRRQPQCSSVDARARSGDARPRSGEPLMVLRRLAMARNRAAMRGAGRVVRARAAPRRSRPRKLLRNQGRSTSRSEVGDGRCVVAKNAERRRAVGIAYACRAPNATRGSQLVSASYKVTAAGSFKSPPLEHHGDLDERELVEGSTGTARSGTRTSGSRTPAQLRSASSTP